MSTDQDLWFGAVLEGPTDGRTVCGLVDRLLAERTPWIQDLHGYLDSFRTWMSPDGPGYLAWRDVARIARGRVPPRHGYFAGEPGLEDAVTAVLALRLFQSLSRHPDAVLLVRDSDGRPKERRRGLEQARDDAAWPFEVVIGVAHHNREAWVLAGFELCEPGEHEKLEEEHRKLGFYPNREPDRLDAKDEQALKSTKRVLRQLTGGDGEREERCWKETDLQTLKMRGAAAGLADFIEALDARLVPVATRPRGSPTR